jgi:hypothetical protein
MNNALERLHLAGSDLSLFPLPDQGEDGEGEHSEPRRVRIAWYENRNALTLTLSLIRERGREFLTRARDEISLSATLSAWFDEGW